MAQHEIPKGMVAVHDKVLAPGVVDSVAFAEDPSEVEVLSDGAAAIYVSINGTDPTVGGANTYVLPPTPCKRTIRHRGDRPLKLISAGTPKYSVTVL